MSIPIIPHGTIHDILMLFWFSAFLTLLYMTYLMIRRVSKDRILSAMTGYALFILCFAIYVFLRGFYYFFNSSCQIFNMWFFDFSFFFMWLGFIFIVFFTELSNKINDPKKKRKLYFPFTLITIFIDPIILLGFKEFFGIAYEITGAIAAIPTMITHYNFMNQFNNLNIVRVKKPVRWFILGMFLSGFSNALHLPDMWSLIPNWNLLLHYNLIIIGLFMASYCWNILPDISEMDWLQKLDKLLIIQLKSNVLIHQFYFTKGEIEQNNLDDIVGSALGGISSLLKEILSKKGHLREIDHAEKKIIVHHGQATMCLMFTRGSSSEILFRTEMFHLAFEKRFGVEEINNWVADLSMFSKIDDIVIKHFLR